MLMKKHEHTSVSVWLIDVFLIVLWGFFSKDSSGAMTQ